MKKYFLLFSIFIIGLSACKKGDIVAEQASVDDAKIKAYMQANGYTGMTKDPSGLYYQIITPGTGAYPIATSTTKVAYTAYYLDGQEFTSAASTSLTLSDNLIQGFTIGIPLINTGGRIRLIIPSGLAYGATGGGAVPANAVLVYIVDLLGFY